MVTETLLVAMLCDPFIKKLGLFMGTHWELEWNTLGTNGKMEDNHSLLGAKFDTILYKIFLAKDTLKLRAPRKFSD